MFTVIENLPFTEEEKALTLDVYLPENDDRLRPCILVIQGGGFRPQNGKRFRPCAEYFAGKGMVCSLISYRGIPDHTCKDTLSDAKAAVRYMRTKHETYGVDPDRIGAMGRSAGATIAVLSALTAEAGELEGSGGNAEISSRLQAVAGISGVYDFIGRFQKGSPGYLEGNHEEKQKTNGDWIGEEYDAESEEWKNASAVSHVGPEGPPVFLLHSKDDGVVSWAQSKILHDKIKEQGGDSTLYLADDGGHAGPEDQKERMLEFFHKVFEKSGEP